SQTSIFCVEYCLTKLWESWGIKPTHVIGHSLGEFAAAVCANILNVEDALKLVGTRSKLIDSLPNGKMVAVKTSLENIKKHLETSELNLHLDYAAHNAEDQVVLAGCY